VRSSHREAQAQATSPHTSTEGQQGFQGGQSVRQQGQERKEVMNVHDVSYAALVRLHGRTRADIVLLARQELRQEAIEEDVRRTKLSILTGEKPDVAGAI
jgi:hypothetical protein